MKEMGTFVPHGNLRLSLFTMRYFENQGCTNGINSTPRTRPGFERDEEAAIITIHEPVSCSYRRARHAAPLPCSPIRLLAFATSPSLSPVPAGLTPDACMAEDAKTRSVHGHEHVATSTIVDVGCEAHVLALLGECWGFGGEVQ